MLILCLFASLAQAHVSTEVAFEEGLYRVYEVEEQTGQLPQLRTIRSYPTEVEARFAAAQVADPDFTPKALPAPLPTQTGFLWPVTQAWNWDWELRYAQWIEREVDESFFAKHLIATDCADVAVALRWIFARVHGLPAGFHLMGSGQFFHQDVVNEAWRRLPQDADWTKDERFRASLRYVLRLTYTHTLFADSYPIAITPASMLPGVHHLNLHPQSGHTQMIIRVDLSDTAAMPIDSIASTIPAGIRKLYRGEFLQWEAADPTQSALLRVRWPERLASGEWDLRAKDSHPSFSLEQFAPGFKGEQESYSDAVLRHLNPNLDYGKRLESLLKTVQGLWQTRVAIVEDGYAACQREDCSPGTAAYELWSTPSRDTRIREAAQMIRNLVTIQGEVRPTLREAYRLAGTQEVVTIQSHPLRLGFLEYVWQNGWMSSEPTVPVAERWALAPIPLATRVQQDVANILDARASSVQQALLHCVPLSRCALGTAEWTQRNSFELDRGLRALLESPARYTRLLPAALTATAEAAFANSTYLLEGSLVSHSELLDRAAWFSSSPDVAAPVRWGSQRQLFRTFGIPFKPGERIGISAGGWAWVAQPQPTPVVVSPGGYVPPNSWRSLPLAPSGRLFELSTGQERLPPKGKIWLEYNLRHDVAVAAGEVQTGIFELDLLSLDGRVLFREQFATAEDTRVRWLGDDLLARGRSEVRNPTPGLPPSTTTPQVDLYAITLPGAPPLRSVPFTDPRMESGLSQTAWIAQGQIFYWNVDHLETVSVPAFPPSDTNTFGVSHCVEATRHCLVIRLETLTSTPDGQVDIQVVSLDNGQVASLRPPTSILKHIWSGTAHHPYLVRMNFEQSPPQLEVYRWDGLSQLALLEQGRLNWWRTGEFGYSQWRFATPQGESIWTFTPGQPPQNIQVSKADGEVGPSNGRYFTTRNTQGFETLRALSAPSVVLLTCPAGARFDLYPANESPVNLSNPGQTGVLAFDLDYPGPDQALFSTYAWSPSSEWEGYAREQSAGKILRGKLGPSYGGKVIWYEPLTTGPSIQ